ncbi:MAG: hypothetical protein IT510_13980 [Sulfuritalea sp.]|nr:hypothetical protein [Sulfuritalea sp.]
MTPILMQVPPEQWIKLATGAAFVDGSMVKDAISKQVVTHLQPAGALTKVLANGPLGALDAISSVAANAQLVQIKSLLETLQTVATIGAAASVLNLGVSIGGFALVLSKLKAMDAKLDGIARQLNAIARTLDTDFRAKGYSALNRAESAFELSSPAERKRYWQEAERDLDYLVQHFFQKLVGLGLDDPEALAANSRTRFVMAGTISSQDARDALHWLLACAGARIEILLCLEEPRAAAKLADNIRQWMTGIQIPAKELAQQRLGGRPVPPAQMQTVTAEAVSLSTFLSRSATTYGDRALLCNTLHDRQVDTQKYVMDVRRPSDPVMLMLSEPEY